MEGGAVSTETTRQRESLGGGGGGGVGVETDRQTERDRKRRKEFFLRPISQGGYIRASTFDQCTIKAQNIHMLKLLHRQFKNRGEKWEKQKQILKEIKTL